MPWITPKTNWTAADFYNYTDLNRVENNIAEVRTYLIGIQYVVPAITTITNRTNTSYDLISSINRIEANLDIVRTAFNTPPGWESTVTWTQGTAFTAAHAIRWENSALQLYTLAQNVFASYRYAGQFNAGQEVLG